MEYTTIFHRSPVLLAAVLAVLFLTPGKTRGAPGDLDSTFGTSGKVTTDFSGNVDIGNAAAVQADGRVVVAGFTRDRRLRARALQRRWRP